MIITHVAHAMFLLELDNGMRIVIDPTDEGSGFNGAPIPCDAVLISHGHHDHCCMTSVCGYSQVIDTPGQHTLSTDTKVYALQAFHDDAKGEKRGSTLMFKLLSEKMSVVHLGDLGHQLPQEMQSNLQCDVLLVPVGGYYTINANEAKKTSEQVRARIVIPMHYAIGKTASWPIAPVDEFIALWKGIKASYQPMIRVTAGDLNSQPGLVVLEK